MHPSRIFRFDQRRSSRRNSASPEYHRFDCFESDKRHSHLDRNNNDLRLCAAIQFKPRQRHLVGCLQLCQYYQHIRRWDQHDSLRPPRTDLWPQCVHSYFPTAASLTQFVQRIARALSNGTKTTTDFDGCNVSWPGRRFPKSTILSPASLNVNFASLKTAGIWSFLKVGARDRT